MLMAVSEAGRDVNASINTQINSSSLSQDVKIIIASITVFLANLIALFIVAFLCHINHIKQKFRVLLQTNQQNPPSTKKGTENPLITSNQKFELKENEAYTSVQLHNV